MRERLAATRIGPDGYEPLPCLPSAFSPLRLIAFAIGLAIAITLRVIAFVRDADR